MKEYLSINNIQINNLKNVGIIPKINEPVLKIAETFEIVKVNLELLPIRRIIRACI